MKRTVLSIMLITVLLNACTQQHPTLDDFIINDDIVQDAEDLLNDDPNKGIELEKDAAGGVVTSKNPSEPTARDVKKEKQEPLTIPEIVHKEVIAPKKSQLKSREAVAKPWASFKRRPQEFFFVNKPAQTGFFNPNDLGRHLLGQDEASATKDFALMDHTKAIMDMKASYEDRNLSKMRIWRDQNLIFIPHQDETLFYPFSGPDVVNMLTFFPNQQTYVMMGMEHVGTAESVKEWMKPLTKSKMTTIRKAVESVFVRSFFRTLDMSSDFSRNGTRGVLPGMLLMLKLMDREVTSVQWVTLNENGTLRYLTPEETKMPCANFGLQVKLSHPTQGYEQTLYYFKTDLADDAAMKNSGLRSFIESKIGTTMTFVKSASFLMHMKEFNWIRKTLLTISRAVLQDDTGIPFKYYNQNTWSPRLYGQYVGPYGESFAAFQQPNLNRAYADQPLQLLDFNFGYGYAKIPSHLMLFIRKDIN